MNGRRNDEHNNNDDSRPVLFPQFDTNNNVREYDQSSSTGMPSIPSIETTTGIIYGSSPAAASAAALSFAEAAASAVSPNRPDTRGRTNYRKNSDASNSLSSSNEQNETKSRLHESSTNDGGNTAAAGPSGDTTTPMDNRIVVDAAADQERQILLLVLLAQVCAMHDATPRTFTVHVLDLYERGLLDRESIQFLFELGLVPSTSSTSTNPTAGGLGLITNVSSENAGDVDINSDTRTYSTGVQLLRETEESLQVETVSLAIEDAEESALTTMTTKRTINATTTVNLTQQSRIIETKAIRRQLSLSDQMTGSMLKSKPAFQSDTPTPTATATEADNMNDDSDQTPRPLPSISTSIHDNSDKPWEVEHFPLSLSRYQREFREVKLLNKGSFGQVYHCVRMLDSCDYAIKKIVFDARGYESKNIQRVMREVECLASASDHPNVVHYYTSWLEPSWMTGNVNGNSGQHPPAHRQQHKYLLTGGSGPEGRDSPSNRLLRDLQNLVQHTNSDFTSTRHYDESSSFDRDHRRGSASVDTVDDDSWDASYQSYSLEPFDDAMGDSQPFSWDDDIRRASRTGGTGTGTGTGMRSGKKKNSPYRYQIFLFIQMQLCHPATLADWIRERNKQIPESDHQKRIGPALTIFNQIVCGLAHIHEKGKSIYYSPIIDTNESQPLN